MMNDLESASYQFELSRIQELLLLQGFEVQFINASEEILLDMLVVHLPPFGAVPPSRVIISFIPLDTFKFPHLKLIQLHATVDLQFSLAKQAEVQAFLLTVNNGLALGSFAMGDDQLYFKQVLTLDKTNLLDHDWFTETFSLFMQMYQVFTPLALEVNTGAKTRGEALAAAFGG